MIVDPIYKRYFDYQEQLREKTGNPNAVEFQFLCYQFLTSGNFKKFKNNISNFYQTPVKNKTSKIVNDLDLS